MSLYHGREKAVINMCLYSNNFLFIDIYYKIALDKLGGASKQDVYALPIISKEIASTILLTWP